MDRSYVMITPNTRFIQVPKPGYAKATQLPARLQKSRRNEGLLDDSQILREL